MARAIRLSVSPDDAFSLDVDVMVLKFAQQLYGLDRAVQARLGQGGIGFDLPAVNDDVVIDTRGALGARNVQFVGVPPLRHFQYAEIRDFARRALVSLSRKAPDARSVAFTIHGPGYGLDEVESFESELAGVVEAVDSGTVPKDLESVVFVESNARRAGRLSESLRTLFPGGEITVESSGGVSTLSATSQDTLRNVGYASATKPHLFVAMPFAAEMDDIYHYGIQGAAGAAGLLCERADHEAFTGDIMAWVKERIATASLVIADLSRANPNVYLEVGYAWGCRVPTVLLIDNPDDLKFDVKGQRCITYTSIRQLEDALAKELASLTD